MANITKMDTVVYIALSLGILSIVLGFVALLTQKIYLDAKTQKMISLNVPILGKMKTNYPALVFVVLGFGLSFYVLEKAFTISPQPQQPPERHKIEWTITGSFEDPGINDWRTRGELSFVPPGMRQVITDHGGFKISLDLDEGKTFEDQIQTITFTHPDRPDTVIYPRDEYAAYMKNDPSSKLKKATENVRIYKPIKLAQFGTGQ